jgi:hypothetical protein
MHNWVLGWCWIGIALISLPGMAQEEWVRGRVVDAHTGEPLPGAHVYLNNTTLGTTTNVEGIFRLPVSGDLRELVVSFTGFIPQVTALSKNIPVEVVIRLMPASQDSGEVEVKATRDEEWYLNLERFRRNFLGDSELASGCRILNPEVLVLHYHRPSQLLKVRARDYLYIVNPGLGYRIRYLLEEFTYDALTRELYYAGYPFFEDQYKGKKVPKYIVKNRQKALGGSIPHFIRSAIHNRLVEDGYEVRESVRIVNPERPMDLDPEQLRAQIRQQPVVSVQDSLSVLLRKSRLPKYIYLVSDKPLSGDDIIRKGPSGRYFLHFEGQLQVVYQREKEEPAFRGPYAKGKPRFQKSMLTKKTDQVQVDPSGLVLAPKDLIFEGYMGWEKVGDLMPLDR